MRSILFVVIFHIILSTASAARRPRTRPSGRSETSVSAGDRRKCDHTKNNIEEVAISFKSLQMVGDRDLLLSAHDAHQKEHCDDAKRHMANFYNHLNCLDGKHRDELIHLAIGFDRWVKKRCDSKEWHDQFIELSKCIAHIDVAEQLHSCGDRVHASFAFILKNIPAKDQMLTTCCVSPFSVQCVQNRTREVCGKKTADFVMQTAIEPWYDMITHICGKKLTEHCSADLLMEFEKISKSRVKTKHTGFYRLYLRIAENAFTLDDL